MITELNEYQTEAVKTISKDIKHEELNKYCAMKLCEEVGEISSIIAKHHYHGKEFNAEHLKEEMSDLFWYLANMAHANGFSLSEIATFNIEKLRKRHGDEYDPSYYKGVNNGCCNG